MNSTKHLPAETVKTIDDLVKHIKTNYSRKTIIDFDSCIYDLNFQAKIFNVKLIKTDKIAISRAIARIENKNKTDFFNFYILASDIYSLSEEQFVVAHELGHILLLHHFKEKCELSMKNQEREANYFAQKLTRHGHSYSDIVLSLFHYLLAHPIRAFQDLFMRLYYSKKIIAQYEAHKKNASY